MFCSKIYYNLRYYVNNGKIRSCIIIIIMRSSMFKAKHDNQLHAWWHDNCFLKWFNVTIAFKSKYHLMFFFLKNLVVHYYMQLSWFKGCVLFTKRILKHSLNLKWVEDQNNKQRWWTKILHLQKVVFTSSKHFSKLFYI